MPLNGGLRELQPVAAARAAAAVAARRSPRAGAMAEGRIVTWLMLRRLYAASKACGTEAHLSILPAPPLDGTRRAPFGQSTESLGARFRRERDRVLACRSAGAARVGAAS